MVKLEEPDKGQAWVIVIAVSGINFILMGITRMTTLLYVAVIATYGVSRQHAAEPFVFAEAVYDLAGPIIGVIGQRFGVKTATFWGGVICSLGIALSSIATNVFWLTIFWGGLFGFGFGLATTLYPVLINQYFVKYGATAYGIAMSGQNIGAFVLPFVINAVLDAFGLSGGFLILAGITMHVLPFSLLLKSPQWIENPKQYARLKALKLKRQTLETLEKGLTKAASEGGRKLHVQECHITEDLNHAESIYRSNNMSFTASFSRRNIDARGITSAESSHAFPIPTISGELEKKQNNISSSNTCEKTNDEMSGEKTSLLDSIRGIATLYTNPVFILMSLCTAVHIIVKISVSITIVDYGNDKRIAETCGIYIINSLTTGDLIGKLCLGWITDKKILSISTYLALTFILQSGIILLLPLVMNLYCFMLLLALYAATVGNVVIHYDLLLLRYVDRNLQSVAMGCDVFLSGIVSFAIPTIVGHFRDDIGSYDGMFYLMGTVNAVFGCFWYLIPNVAEFHNKKTKCYDLQEKVKIELHFEECKITRINSKINGQISGS